MEEDEKDQLKDAIVIMSAALEAAKEQKVALERYGVQIARAMDKLKTEQAKQDLAEITQANYKKMIEFEIRMAEIESTLKAMKIQLIMGE